jgi:hypothetical protein
MQMKLANLYGRPEMVKQAVEIRNSVINDVKNRIIKFVRDESRYETSEQKRNAFNLMRQEVSYPL